MPQCMHELNPPRLSRSCCTAKTVMSCLSKTIGCCMQGIFKVRGLHAHKFFRAHNLGALVLAILYLVRQGMEVVLCEHALPVHLLAR